MKESKSIKCIQMTNRFSLSTKSALDPAKECYMSRPKEKTIFTWIMFALTIWSIFLSTSELMYLGWRTIKQIYKKNVAVTVFGEEITPHKNFRFLIIWFLFRQGIGKGILFI